jgi:hypothetical protein
VPVDYDHDGDVDLLLVGSFGARIWRNDGGTFVDASAASLANRAFDWAVAEDFDGDNDVDLLLGSVGVSTSPTASASKFADKTRVFPVGTALAARPIIADVDGGGRRTSSRPTRRGWKDGTFARTARSTAIPQARSTSIDLDGTLDVVGANLRSPRRQHGAAEQVAIAGLFRSVAAADFDGDRTVDVAVGTPTGVSIRNGKPSANHGVRLSYRGARSNRRALGSVVEYRAGPVYRRIYWRGELVLAGVGTAKAIDVLRITWPNGIVQSDLELDLAPVGGVDDRDACIRSITEARRRSSDRARSCTRGIRTASCS